MKKSSTIVAVVLAGQWFTVDDVDIDKETLRVHGWFHDRSFMPDFHDERHTIVVDINGGWDRFDALVYGERFL